MLQYFETLNGQTLIENKDGYLEFAKLDLNQNMVTN